MRKFIYLAFLAFILSLFLPKTLFAREERMVCAVYFTGIGCPHCAKADPVVLEELLERYPNLVVIEYEIYQQQENSPLLYEYNESYGSGLHIPLLIFGRDGFLVGDNTIIKGAPLVLEEKTENPCPLVDGTSAAFEGLDVSSLPGRPKILTGSGGEVAGVKKEQEANDLTLAKILSLAAADSVNPCSLAVLTAMLLTILTYNPKKKRNILLAGLSFTASVFVMYLFYGLVIIRFFQLIQALTTIRLVLYKILGVAAMVLGLLNIKEFLEGNSSCHVVPQIGRFLSKITSPKGAFTIGALVTVFLLPCTIGPYIICGGILCPLSLLKTLPWLLLYNLVFVLPMVGVTAVTYLGFSTVENISGWQEKNIKYLNLVSGLIIFGLGLAMLLGWV